ncbi:thiol:disulfide interchange protein DsbE [Marinobacter nanhaiticus D15-8W]|uniref:DsbE family thiol:disulfide interchange protein n=1 Tax=Marinobacter nanhaiticus D15-8W TaxID=626887 RepID=N6X7E0_9GAMM|nr:DsbE family thiol:disulfide interchange protein [Marinobacter nanhaiticus]ENO17068.1 DsbE family thiol:disulfide interchange protein [Marinobacter nanhaiticus D15-8W]BES71936.1 thiol:disulfide interchange protein DsbE [Marinobacter nanhaiticus D15-8W]
MRRFLLFIPLLLAVALGVVLFAGIGKDTSALESALIDDPVPAFELASLEDPHKIYRADVFQDKVVLLNVWGTWCPSCRVEHSELVRLATEEGVPIYGLNYKDNRDAALEWLNNLGNPYELSLFDPQGTLGFDLGVYGAPETYIIDGEGIVRYRHVGVVDRKVWTEELEPRIRQYREES